MQVPDYQQFAAEGYSGPFPLLSEAEAESLLQERFFPPSFLTWYKSPHEKSLRLFKAASSANLVEIISKLMGKDILLWASYFIGQKPGQKHGWHLDVEFANAKGLTVWLGLKNLESTKVSVISGSHLLNVTPQELSKSENIDIYDNEAILLAAKKLDPNCELKEFILKPGECVIWSGKAWHTTTNEGSTLRHCIIFQYCTPDSQMKIPLNYEYPNTKWSDVQPPCIQIDGQDLFKRNCLVDKPKSSLIYSFRHSVILWSFRFKYLLGTVKRMLVKS